MKSRWEILILPLHRGGGSVRFVVSRWQVILGGVIVGMFLLAAVAGFVFFSRMAYLQARLLAVSRERDALLARVEKIQEVEEELSRLREFRERVARMLVPEHLQTTSAPANEVVVDEVGKTPLTPPPDPFLPTGLPTRGYLSRGFSKNHPGIDLSAPYGTPVVATADGRVHAVREDPVYGKVVEIVHGKRWKTRYAHLQSFVVSPGDTVRRGQVIGFVGSTGVSTGPHLHYEVIQNKTPLDPLLFLGPDLELLKPAS